MRDRRADAILNSLFVGHSSILQIADALDVVLLPVSSETASTVADDYGIIVFTIPASAYEWNDSRVLTVSLSAHLFVLDTYSEQVVEELTVALIQNMDRLKSVHTAMQPLDINLMASSSAIPYHPGAIKVYMSKGLMQ